MSYDWLRGVLVAGFFIIYKQVRDWVREERDKRTFIGDAVRKHEEEQHGRRTLDGLSGQKPRCSEADVQLSAMNSTTLKVFVSIAATLAGIILLLAVPYNGFFWDNWPQAFLGVILLAGGLTYFWKSSRLAK